MKAFATEARQDGHSTNAEILFFRLKNLFIGSDPNRKGHRKILDVLKTGVFCVVPKTKKQKRETEDSDSSVDTDLELFGEDADTLLAFLPTLADRFILHACPETVATVRSKLFDGSGLATYSY